MRASRRSHQIWLSTIVLVITASNIFAQEDVRLNPPSMKWSQLNTPAGRVIFPRGLDTLAFYAGEAHAGMTLWPATFLFSS